MHPRVLQAVEQALHGLIWLRRREVPRQMVRRYRQGMLGVDRRLEAPCAVPGYRCPASRSTRSEILGRAVRAQRVAIRGRTSVPGGWPGSVAASAHLSAVSVSDGHHPSRKRYPLMLSGPPSPALLPVPGIRAYMGVYGRIWACIAASASSSASLLLPIYRGVIPHLLEDEISGEAYFHPAAFHSRFAQSLAPSRQRRVLRFHQRCRLQRKIGQNAVATRALEGQ